MRPRNGAPLHAPGYEPDFYEPQYSIRYTEIRERGQPILLGADLRGRGPSTVFEPLYHRRCDLHGRVRSAGYLLIADKTPLVVVASNLGHAQTSTTSDIYSHVIASAEAKAAEVLDKFSDEIHPKFTPTEKKEGVS